MIKDIIKNLKPSSTLLINEVSNKNEAPPAEQVKLATQELTLNI